MTTHQLNLLAGISIAVCWCAFVATWLAAENYGEARVPAERTRSRFGTAVTPGLIIVTVISVAVPEADWHSLSVHAPAGSDPGAGVPDGRDRVYDLGPARAGRHVERRARGQAAAPAPAPAVRTASPGIPFTPESWACCSAPCWWPGRAMDRALPRFPRRRQKIDENPHRGTPHAGRVP